jgi:hypothetical protein
MKLSEKTLKTMGYVFIIIAIFFELAIISKMAKDNTPIPILLLTIGIIFFSLAKKKKKRDETVNGN